MFCMSCCVYPLLASVSFIFGRSAMVSIWCGADSAPYPPSRSEPMPMCFVFPAIWQM